MPLTKVTITGADDAVDPTTLAELSREFPFVEWGVLLSGKRAGTTRYPSAEWRLRLTNECVRGNLSLHLCGAVAWDTLDGDSTWAVYAAQLGFRRIQVNGFEPGDAFYNLVSRFGHAVEWILQLKPMAVEPIFSDLEGAAQLVGSGGRVSALFDGSGGRGLRPLCWAEPPAWLRTGFAGGIDPDNVRQVLRELPRVRHAFWIDIESGVRTNDRLDLAKVRAVLEATAPLVPPTWRDE